MLSTLQKLVVVASFSRPSVSDDNLFTDSMFRTIKYTPSYPAKLFESIEEHENRFMNSYSGIMKSIAIGVLGV